MLIDAISLGTQKLDSRMSGRSGCLAGGQPTPKAFKIQNQSFQLLRPTPRVLTQRPTAPNDGDGPARREGALRASGVVAHRCESRAASSVPLPASPLPLSTPPLPLSSVQGRPTRPQSQLRCDPPVRAVYWSLLPHVASASRSFSPLSSELVEQRRLDGLPAAPQLLRRVPLPGAAADLLRTTRASLQGYR